MIDRAGRDTSALRLRKSKQYVEQPKLELKRERTCSRKQILQLLRCVYLGPCLKVILEKLTVKGKKNQAKSSCFRLLNKQSRRNIASDKACLRRILIVFSCVRKRREFSA